MDNKIKVVIFGVGGDIFRVFSTLIDYSKVDIIALSDNNGELHGKEVNGIEIIKPDKISYLKYDYVIITSKYYEDIEMQLLGYGLKKTCILNFYELYVRISPSDFRWSQLMKNAVFLIECENTKKEDFHSLLEKNLFLNSKSLSNCNRNKKLNSLAEVEFQVFSQFGEDGIIQWLIHNVNISNKTFIEFGVEDYTEANTRFLLMNDNWSGFVIDGSEKNIQHLKNWNDIWKYDLLVTSAFITKDNINQLIKRAGFNGDIGILSIDLDGNDYWILNTIDCIQPRILICEYNNIYGNSEVVSVPYNESFVRTKEHYSNLYWGASLGAYCDWADKNGYYYMGSNSAGNNAFFVRKDCISIDKVPINAKTFIPSKYRESRGRDGRLTYLRGDERLHCIKEMKLMNLKTGSIDTIANIYHI